MLRPWLSSLLAIGLARGPAAAQEFFPSAGPLLAGGGPPPEPTTPTMYRSVCFASAAGTNDYAQTLTFPGVDDSWTVEVVVIALGEDSASLFGVSGITFDGVGGSEIADEDGTGGVNAALYVRSMTGASSVSTVTTYGEGVTSNVVCGWAFAGLASATPDSSAFDDDTASGPLVLTLGTTNATGFAVGGCINTGIADTTTWAVLGEQEDTEHAEADYSNADASATGASMAVTCDWSGSTDASGVAAAFH
jgi:hypothetical protein